VGGDWPACSGLFWRAPPLALAAHCVAFFKPHHLSLLYTQRARAQAVDVHRLQEEEEEICTPDHLIEELPGEGESKDEEGEAEWKDDPLAPIRRLALPGLGAGIRDKSTGSRHGTFAAGTKTTPSPEWGRRKQMQSQGRCRTTALRQYLLLVRCSCGNTAATATSAPMGYIASALSRRWCAVGNTSQSAAVQHAGAGWRKGGWSTRCN
jgi:hypothetical protein